MTTSYLKTASLTVALLLCLSYRASAEDKPLGLTARQVLKMTDSRWIAYYEQKTHARGARAVYRALVIYCNCEKERNAHDLQRLSRASRQRYQSLDALLQQRVVLSGWKSKPGNAAASHALGEQRGIADLLHHILALHRQSASNAPAQNARRHPTSKVTTGPRTAATPTDAASLNDKIARLVQHWPPQEKQLVLNYLQSHSDSKEQE